MAFFGESTMGIANQGNKTIKCPFCDEPVEHNKEQDFYKCPTCGCEIWPEQEANAWNGLYDIYCQEVNRPHKPGRSNRSGRKETKKKPPLFTQRYLL